MSTILQALLKSKFEQTGGAPSITQQISGAVRWKVAFSIATFISITLLSALLYLLLNPSRITQINVKKTQVVESITNNQLVKVTFETQPLPTTVAITKVEKTVTPIKVDSLQKNTQRKSASPKSAVSKEVLPKEIEKTEQVTNYEKTPSDLQKRFELAVLLTEIEQNKNPNGSFIQEEEFNDGSDIHDMSSDFQNKVPLMRYDSHMYSSLIDERWVRINGETLKEGDFDSTGQLELLEIQPQRSIFRVERQSFSVESLTDWEGY
jgi:general secretion pathway protein B